MPGRPARLAFQTINRDVDLRLIDLDVRPVNDVLESHPFSNSTRVEGSARFSPDGRHVAFVSYRSGAPQVWVAGRDGSGLRQLTTLDAAGVFLSGWSPDGTRIAFEAAVAGNSDVYVIGADGGHSQRLTTEPSIDGTPVWSRDGQWIYFTSTRPGAIPNVWQMPATGGKPTRLTHDGGFQPQESSDGRSLYYLDRWPGGAPTEGRVMRVPVGGGTAEPVVEHVWPFLWAVTNTGIVFIARTPEFDALDVYRFGDRQVTRLGRLGFRIPRVFPHMSASRDARWVLATKMERFDSDLMLLENFR